MIRHEAALRLAATSLDFELSQAERSELGAHLASCPACAADARAMRVDVTFLAGVSVPPLDHARGEAILASALGPSRRVAHPLRLVLVAALVGLLALGSMLVGSVLLERSHDDLSVVPPAPSPSVAAPSPSGSGAPGPSPAPPAVPAIDAAYTPAVADGTRGAFALRLRGSLAGTEVSGSATCLWGWETGDAVAQGIAVEGVALLGETVSVYTNPGGLAIHRLSGGEERARYEPASAPRQWQGQDLTVMSFDDLEVVSTAEPETGPAASSFYEPLGGLAAAAHLAGDLGWRCEVPASPPPSPYAAPSPTCPAPTTLPQKPVIEVGLQSGAKVTAVAGSYDLVTCTTAENGDTPLTEPDRPLVAQPTDRPSVTVSDGWRFLRWSGGYRPRGSQESTSWAAVDLASRPRAFELPAIATPGDWVVDLALVMTTDDGRAIGTFTFSVLLRVGS